MKRYFDEGKFIRLCQDFKFLAQKINDSEGELDLRLRDNYFNLYYKGNSLAKVTSRKKDYEVAIHKKFIKSIFDDDKRFTIKRPSKADYCYIYTGSDLLPSLFQEKHLNKLCSNIKEEHYSEEITFEQMLITDNMDRKDLLIIDRQVTETRMPGKLDLLALKQKNGNNFYLQILEVKLGNNKELKEDVGEQLDRYVQYIVSHIGDWGRCYEEVYKQMKELGLLRQLPWDRIKIIDEVKGYVVVGGYSGIAKNMLNNLKIQYPKLEIKQFVNKL